MSDRRSPPSSKQQQQQEQQKGKALERPSQQRQSQQQQQTTAPEQAAYNPSPAFYPLSIPRPEYRGSYERPAGSSRRPYDAVLDASPPPSSVLTDSMRGSRPSPSSAPFSTYGMPITPDIPVSYSSSGSSTSSQRAELPSRHARKTSRADQQPYPSPSTRAAMTSSYGFAGAGEGEEASHQQSYPSSSRHAHRGEPDRRQKPSLQGFAGTRSGWKYRLVVVQHPTRARMCGFGDKDRRPLSPTLIVKLIITDERTGEEISPWKVNTSLFFLASDLCHPDDLMLSPRNVLVHQHAATIPASLLQPSYGADYQASQQQQGPSSPYPPPPHSASSSGSNAPLPPLGSLYLGDRGRGQEYSQQQLRPPTDEPAPPPSTHSAFSYPSMLTTVTTEHYTRNLVGAAVTSANVLRDEQDNYCIFFVLQDLSVRTEGVYRIRLIFTNLAMHDGQTNEGVSEALAEAYTEPFSVYSPRRFPGMLEPTELSKKLASQGIKIAVRSDKKKRQRSQETGEASGLPGEMDGLEEEEDE